jgi:hypothetical protein
MVCSLRIHTLCSLASFLLVSAAFAQSGLPTVGPRAEPPKPKDTPAAPTQPAPAGNAAPTVGAGSWIIVLGAFRGEQAQASAQQFQADINSTGLLPGSYITQRGPSVVVALGQFAQATSEEAQRQLTKVRETEIKGVRPFASSFLAPPDDRGALGSVPEYALSRAREQFGKRARYTLQVGAYGKLQGAEPKGDELAEIRKAAEQACLTLRREGELAFYHHGPTMSMVTIGVFGDGDLADQGDAKSNRPPRQENPAIGQLKRRFPYNLFNGGGIKEKLGIGAEKKEAKLQESMLVRIPER